MANKEKMTDSEKSGKKKMIADVAFDLFLSNGYITTKIVDIASKAGIGKGTVYEYFDSKESILLYLIENRVAVEYSQMMEKVTSCPDNTEKKLRAYLRAEVEFIKKYGRYIDDMKRQFLQANTDIAEDIMYAICEIIRMQFETVLSIVEKGIEEGVLRDINPQFITTCISSYVSAYLTTAFGMAVWRDVKGERMEIPGVQGYNEDELLDIIMHGIGA